LVITFCVTIVINIHIIIYKLLRIKTHFSLNVQYETSYKGVEHNILKHVSPLDSCLHLKTQVKSLSHFTRTHIPVSIFFFLLFFLVIMGCVETSRVSAPRVLPSEEP
jgi:hypothetical protein